MGLVDQVEYTVKRSPDGATAAVRVTYTTGIAKGTSADFIVFPQAGEARMGPVVYRKVK